MHSKMKSLVHYLTMTLITPVYTTDNYINHMQHNYWLNPVNQDQYAKSKFKAYENTTDFFALVANQYNMVHSKIVEDVLNETNSIDVALLERNETVDDVPLKLDNNTKLDMIFKKYMYFKSKYYFEINKWYYDVIFNMRKYFKDKHKYLGNYRDINLIRTYQLLDYERDIDVLFNNIAYKYRDKISTQMKSLRMKFYYFINMVYDPENCDSNEKDEFKDIIMFSMKSS